MECTDRAIILRIRIMDADLVITELLFFRIRNK